jgi:hypothetical protein
MEEDIAEQVAEEEFRREEVMEAVQFGAIITRVRIIASLALLNVRYVCY